MTQPAKVHEPSMEEILASIRRIIADDEEKPSAAEMPASPPAPPAKPEKLAVASPPAKPAMKDIPVSNIPAAVAAAKAAAPAPPAPPAPSPPALVANNSQDDIDALLAGFDQATNPEEIRFPRPNDEADELTGDRALPAPPQASFQRVEPRDDVGFAEPSASRAVHRPPADDPPAPSKAILSQSTAAAVETAFDTLANTVLSNTARTLEDLVRDMLRPMLKSWLDDNLPGLVERIVKAEIERVSRGR